MTGLLRTALLAALACTLAAGCSKSSQPEASGKAGLIAVSAIVDAPDIAFLIEERALGGVGFGGATAGNRFDDLDYTFNFEINVPGEAAPRRIASRYLDVVRETSYLFVVGGTLASPQVYLYDDPERVWEETDTVFELAFAHVSNELDAIDVYFDATGVAPVLGNARGTLTRGERIPTAEFAAGDYVLTVTAQGDPQDVLFVSDPNPWNSASSNHLLFMDNDPSRTGNVTVRRVTASGTNLGLGDPRFPPAARILHAAFGIGNVDLAENADYDNLIADNLAFAEITDDTPLTVGTNTYTFTDAGNSGAPIIERDYFVGTGLNQTLILAGPPGEPQLLTYPGNRRPFATSGRFGIVHTATTFELLDVYLLEAGQAIEDNVPFFSFVQLNAPVTPAAIEAKDYELTIKASFEDTIAIGPVPLTISNGDIVEIYVLETAEPTVAELKIVRY